MPKFMMRDIVIEACTLLSLSDVRDLPQLGGSQPDSTAERDLSTLVACVNTTAREIAAEYLPLTQREQVQSTGRVELAQLEMAAHEILEVLFEGERARFEVFHTYFTAPSGEIEVKYSYLPKKAELGGHIECAERVTERLVTLGAASEYCLIKGRYEDAEMFERHFVSVLKNAMSANRPLRLPSRRWQ